MMCVLHCANPLLAQEYWCVLKIVIQLCAASSSTINASGVYNERGVDLNTLAAFKMWYYDLK